MTSKEVLKLLKVTRPTLTSYVKNGKVRVEPLHNGYYNYNKEDVFKLLSKDVVRKNIIYSRVSTKKQKNDLVNQEQTLIQFCNKSGYTIHDSYKDISSGMNFERKGFNQILDDLFEFKIDKLFITYKDRLSRLSFDMIKTVFKEFGCDIVVINDIDDPKTVEKEIFNEIISIIHCFSMKLYSSRRREKFKLLEKDLQMEDDAISL